MMRYCRVALVALALAGCTPSAGHSSSGATLTANPNPVPAGTGTATTTVAWDTGDGSNSQVYVSEEGGPEQLFAAGASGSKDAPWIRTDTTYEFRLYAGTDHQARLASLSVTRGER